MDAGVPNALQLTRKVYENLRDTSFFEEARLYGYVLGKLITSRARKGVSPFREVGIEDVYATLKRFLSRHSDVLSEFVYSWDDFAVSPDFDAAKFHEHLSMFISRRVNGDHRHALGSEGPGAYIKATLGALPQYGENAEAKLRPFITALTRCLQPADDSPEYMQTLVEYCDSHFDLTASLNYDLVFEDACKSRGISVDHGLSQWNDKKLVQFHGQSIKLAKLHGSIDWYESGDDIIIAPSETRRLKRGMVFGAQSEKLVPDGPYLQLRSEFEKSLRRTNKIGVIGYSFQDLHVNSLVRIWLLTRRRGKIVILDPADRLDGFASLGHASFLGMDGKSNLKVDCVHVHGTTRDKLKVFMGEVLSEPILAHEGRNTFGMRVV